MPTGDLIIEDSRLGVGTTDNLSTLTVRARPAFNLSGTLTRTIASATVTGGSTRFLTELAVGDRIRVGPDMDDDETRTVAAIASDTLLTVDHPYTSTATAQASVARPSATRFDDQTGNTTLIVNDQGSIGLGRLAPNASLHVVGGGAGDWRGYPVTLRVNQPAGGYSWGLLMTSGPEAVGCVCCDHGVAMWVDELPERGSTLTFTMTDADHNQIDVLRVDGTGLSMPMGFTANPTFVSTEYEIASSDHYVYVDAGPSGHTVTLPLINDSYGQVLWIFKSAGAGNVTIAPRAGDTINGATTAKIISAAYEAIKLVALADTWVATRQPAA